MSEKTEISWCDATWSPWEGCTKISPGCDNCYAESMNHWLRKGENWGPGKPRREFSAAHWEKPLRWDAKARKDGKRLRVFPSVCDPFDNEADPQWRVDLFALIHATPNLDWLLLTKRIGNVNKMLAEALDLACKQDGGPDECAPWLMRWANGEAAPRNVWLGATIVNREEMLRDGPKLKAVPARVRFWSGEPLLGDIGPIPAYLLPDWVISGGESGRKARKANPAWFRSLRDQCAAAGVPFHFKQWGEWAPYDRGRTNSAMLANPGSLDEPMSRFGKHINGRLLDGIEHIEFPASA